ncbi:hypothetical protein GGX14DRAFT_404044 [Mycena pura]|uniref:Uncharacterized protein n=1 Tax=Mycena pura TaxID=153505 RepID=A0AAD6Y0J1_9AGAR|nr:hypothetical protein GGX14DRAFT_404044 [Mycena pura]
MLLLLAVVSCEMVIVIVSSLPLYTTRDGDTKVQTFRSRRKSHSRRPEDIKKYAGAPFLSLRLIQQFFPLLHNCLEDGHDLDITTCSPTSSIIADAVDAIEGTYADADAGLKYHPAFGILREAGLQGLHENDIAAQSHADPGLLGHRREDRLTATSAIAASPRGCTRNYFIQQGGRSAQPSDALLDPAGQQRPLALAMRTVEPMFQWFAYPDNRYRYAFWPTGPDV